MLTGDLHHAVEAEAAVPAPETGCTHLTPIIPVLVLPAATHGVLVHGARRNLHLVHFWRGEEMGCEPQPHHSVCVFLRTHVLTHVLTHAHAFPPTSTSRDLSALTRRQACALL